MPADGRGVPAVDAGTLGADGAFLADEDGQVPIALREEEFGPGGRSVLHQGVLDVALGEEVGQLAPRRGARAVTTDDRYPLLAQVARRRLLGLGRPGAHLGHDVLLLNQRLGVGQVLAGIGLVVAHVELHRVAVHAAAGIHKADPRLQADHPRGLGATCDPAVVADAANDDR